MTGLSRGLRAVVARWFVGAWLVGGWLAGGAIAPVANADAGKPVAIRSWGQGRVSIETYWNLRVLIDPRGEVVGGDKPSPARDLVVATGRRAGPKDPVPKKDPTAGGGRLATVYGLAAEGDSHAVDLLLDRLPGEDRPWRRPWSARVARSRHAARLRTLATRPGRAVAAVVDVDGVRIVHAGGLGEEGFSSQALQRLGVVDVLCVSVGAGVADQDGPAIRAIEQLAPRYVVLLLDQADHPVSGPQAPAGLVAGLQGRYEVDRQIGNTLAVGAADGDDETSTRVALLGYEPWRPADELAGLMKRMESACSASQKVFAKLSAEQLNWRPPNGSHTARWNAEHMMGRQLGFFSQIYAALDPEIAAINLNPRQMPPDYEPAHPGWGGAEEARQMERSAAFVRRFAYLLDGVDLDKRAPGSRWTLRRLLLQMERHFNQHTANVRKKFELEGWPAG